jgi:hypothetical protein
MKMNKKQAFDFNDLLSRNKAYVIRYNDFMKLITGDFTTKTFPEGGYIVDINFEMKFNAVVIIVCHPDFPIADNTTNCNLMPELIDIEVESVREPRRKLYVG